MLAVVATIALVVMIYAAVSLSGCALPSPSMATGGVLAMPAAAAVPKGTLAKVLAKLKAALGANATPTDAEIEAALAAELTETDPPPDPPAPPPPTPPATGDAAAIAVAIRDAVAAAVAPLQQELSTVKGALETEASTRAEAQKAVETQRTKERETAVTTALDAAVKDGRIVPAKRDAWKARLEADLDGAKSILDEMPANPALAKANAKNGAGPPPADGVAPPAARPDGSLGALRPDVLAYVTANTN